MKRKFLAGLLSLCMIFSLMPMSVFAESTADEVATYEELVEALKADNANIIMTADIEATATEATGYGKAGIVLNKGDVLNGNGKKLTINGADATWDCAIAMLGGEVKNLSVEGAFRGIFMPGANGDVKIDNVTLDKVCYTFNSDGGSKDYGVYISNTTLNGWTSYSDVHKEVVFTNCNFGKGTGAYQYAYFRPYQETTFESCNFDEGYEFDTSKTDDNSLEFNDCKYAEEPISSDNNDMFFNGGKVVIDGENTDVNHYQVKINGKGYATLSEAFETIGNANGGDVVIDIVVDEIDMSAWQGYSWNSYNASGANNVTVNGNGVKLTKMTKPLFLGTWTGKTLAINDITISEPAIVLDENDDTGNTAVGAFVANVSCNESTVLTNCNVIGGSVKGGHWTGGLIGYAAGYSNQSDGPVFTTVTINNCTVEGVEISGKGSAGGIVGHATGDAWTKFDVQSATVKNNTITSTGNDTNKAGSIMGTIGAAGQETHGKTGGVYVSATTSGNAVTSNGTAITTIYGRQGTATGVLTMNEGGSYDAYPVEDNSAYVTVAAGLHICEDNGVFTVHGTKHKAEVPATCTATGTKEYYECEFGKMFEDAAGTKEITDPTTLEIKKLDHTPAADPAVAPGCTTTGLTAGEHCSVCGTVLTAQQTVAATGHSFGGWYTVKEPVCHDAGYEARACACGETESRALNATAHNFDVNGVCAICGISKNAPAPSRANPNTGVHF